MLAIFFCFLFFCLNERTARIYGVYRYQGFEIFSVCLHASAAKIEATAKEHDLPWIHVCHDRIDGNTEWATPLGIQSVPTTMLVDQTGNVLKFGVRPMHTREELDLEENLKKLLKL